MTVPPTTAIAAAPPAATAPPFQPVQYEQPAVQTVYVQALAPRVQAIEKTGKKWKACILLGYLLMLAGLIGVWLSFLKQSEKTLIGCGAIWALGLGLYIYGRVGAWWYHG